MELSSHKRDSFALLAVLVLLAGTAQSLPRLPRPRPSKPRPTSQQLLIASDLHFNPFADPTSGRRPGQGAGP